MLSRRSMMLTPLALLATRTFAAAADRKMVLALHTNTSSAAGYRGALEGWAKAGIRNVEINAALVDEFLKTDTLAAARRVLTDNALTPVSGAVGVAALLEPDDNHAAAIDMFKRRCEMFATLGLKKVYTTTTGMRRLTADDYGQVVDQMREVGDAARQFNLMAMVEFVRYVSTYMSTLAHDPQVPRARRRIPTWGRCSIAITSGRASTSSKTWTRFGRAKSSTSIFRTSPTCRGSCSTTARASSPVTACRHW